MRRVALVFAVLALACDRPDAPRAATRGAPAPSGSAGAVPTSLTHGAAREVGVTWAEPRGWRKLAPTSPMRNASYEVPAAEGDREPGDLGVFFFGPDRGDAAERNVRRWVEQFEGADPAKVAKTERKVNGLVQRIVEIPSGTYRSGMPGGPTTPKPDYALLGAIVEAPGGSHFFKLVGPKATVAAARAQFFELLDSVKPR